MTGLFIYSVVLMVTSLFLKKYGYIKSAKTVLILGHAVFVVIIYIKSGF